MSTGCLSCLKCIRFRKKQHKPVTAAELPELVKGNDEEEEGVKELPEVVKGNEEEEEEDVKKLSKQFEEKDEEEEVQGNTVFAAPVVPWSYWSLGSSDFYCGQLVGDAGSVGSPSSSGDSCSQTRNDFNKVKTFDIRGVTQTTGK